MADTTLYQEHLAHDGTTRQGKMHAVDQTGHSNKRKRDHDGASDNARHGSFKRASPANNSSRNGIDLGDASGASFLSSQNVSGNGEHDLHNSSNASHDFSALTQQLVQHAATHHNGGQHSASEAASTAAAALAGVFPQMTIPQPTEISFASNTSGGEADRQLDSSFSLGEHESDQNHPGNQPYNLDALRQSTGAQVQAARESSSGGGNGVKPAVGSDEWHKVRRDNHKEVERRRRETINEGINELAKIVPGCEKNKGSILQRAVSFITQLRENETANIEKWTLEKLLTEQAIAELSASVDKLKNECERAWREAEGWKKAALGKGVGVVGVGMGIGAGKVGEGVGLAEVDDGMGGGAEAGGES
ncbi:basic helix-loop-helix protein [Acarospora aff. strigata]|nr:basic helix-loop-helix protein [Acarospora aff. strigata]